MTLEEAKTDARIDRLTADVELLVELMKHATTTLGVAMLSFQKVCDRANELLQRASEENGTI